MPRHLALQPRKSPRQLRSKQTVGVLLQATERVLRKHGYAKATTNRIAETAGVSVGTLYQYFPSKEALVGAVIDRHQDEILASVLEKTRENATRSVREATQGLVQAMLFAHGLDPKLHRTLEEQVPKVGRLDRLREMQRLAIEKLRAYYEQRGDELRVKDPQMASFIVAHVCECLTHAVVNDRPEYLENGRALEAITDLLVRYLTP